MNVINKIPLLRSDIAPGALLIIASILALIMSNSSYSDEYHHFVHLDLPLQLTSLYFDKTLFHWVNDGLMVIFFILIGLEIKSEILVGELSKVSKIALPTIGALGGMILPAIIFYLFNKYDDYALRGWAIPTATDIAFAIAILILLGSKAPKSLKVLLVAIAIIDDLLAIGIIAVFYTEQISFVALSIAAISILVLILMNIENISSWKAYTVVGFLLWVCMVASGVHPTLTGVILGFTIPLSLPNSNRSPLHEMEEFIRPWVSFLILPVFAFVNAGITLSDMSWQQIIGTVPLGIALGLFFGKQLGVFGFSWLAIKLKIAEKPSDVNWAQLYGIAILCGIGFTMSMFIGGLSYEHEVSDYALTARLGVLWGSLLSAVIGYVFLYFVLPVRNEKANSF